jgi:hypothetical protein
MYISILVYNALRTIKRSNQMMRSPLLYRVLAYSPMGLECPFGKDHQYNQGSPVFVFTPPETLKACNIGQYLILYTACSFFKNGNLEMKIRTVLISNEQKDCHPNAIDLYLYNDTGLYKHVLGFVEKLFIILRRDPFPVMSTGIISLSVYAVLYKIYLGQVRTKIHLSDQIDFACYSPCFIGRLLSHFSLISLWVR